MLFIDLGNSLVYFKLNSFTRMCNIQLASKPESIKALVFRHLLVVATYTSTNMQLFLEALRERTGIAECSRR